MKVFKSQGKLLLTAEYLVLDGAKALAIPTSYGQDLTVIENGFDGFKWESLNRFGTCWFYCHFDESLKITKTNDQEIAERLLQILEVIKKLNPRTFSTIGLQFTSKLDFDRNWGLGSSSTLVNNLAQWAGVNPYELLNETFTGSGYDIACASAKNAIFYQLENEQPVIENANFDPVFKDSLYFVHLNQKQDSRAGIKHYRSNRKEHLPIDEINEIGKLFCAANTLGDFQKLITQHENIISKTIDLSPVKDKLFSDYQGAIKSLGAWGGDFMLAAGNDNTMDYFKEKGYETVIKYTEMVFQKD
ncbi:GYDIA family GHMP kinase [Spongiivirga citrea]|uniref:GHMP kinase n=1 Tax=Spongiivirga citrea TaxID=1481457 RepID=A0A6M0CKN3_9FLAO|nr:GYDIA family GHMP kinase [Spongiivirga citrea]NER18212.1 GHMP kinase [Spongiivirga citrea]